MKRARAVAYLKTVSHLIQVPKRRSREVNSVLEPHMKILSCLAVSICLSSGSLSSAMAEDADQPKTTTPTTIHEFKVKSLEGEEVDLAKYKGKVLLIVNVASRCGATPQYKNLQQLHDKFSSEGLVVMGFPCNQFGRQEPGSNNDIKEFCSTKYSVKFPMFDKIKVNGTKQAKLYDFLKSNADDHSDINWNFEKFVVGKDGKVVARFGTRIKPDAPEVLRIIKEQMAM